jgi:hypothetical protein
MVSLIVPVVFFGILVLIYPLASMLLSVTGWARKQWASKHDIKGESAAKMIDHKTDQIKDVMFNILAFIIFFFVSPFVVLLLVR